MKHITPEERHTIDCLLKQNKKPAEIAGILGRSKSTITREIQRNRDQRNKQYRHALAENKAKQRQASKPTRCGITAEMQIHIEARLTHKLSPEQIVGEAKLKGIECVSHECIYQHIWRDKKQGGKLYTHLRHQSKRYRKRGAFKDTRGQIKNKTPLAERPEEVEQRKRIGDLEIDLIIGKGHKGALLTINDRASGLLIIERLQGKAAAEVTDATVKRLEPYKAHLHTITSDNGKEFAGHQTIARMLDIDFYFAKPYHSWERGSNENINGLIRQYIPKNTNILELDDTYIQEVEKALNYRPRKRYGFLSPLAKHQQLTKNQKVALAT